MAGIMNKITGAPKWVLIVASAVLIGLLGFGMYYLMFGSKEKEEDAPPETVLLDMPDGKELEQPSVLTSLINNGKRNDVTDFWDSLEDDDISVTDAFGDPKEEYLDPNIYSSLEITLIQSGVRTKEQVDREHEQEARERAEREARERAEAASRPRTYTQAEQDSMMFGRIERAYQLAAKYSAQESPEDEPAAPAEEQYRRLDLAENRTSSVLPTDSFAGDGIISSLDTHRSGGGAFQAKPIKATFLKSEKLVSGQRVIIRLMQDLPLSNGTLIPANTHITGTCEISQRMKIKISMLHYGGKMFPVDIDAYDNDGSEGIYCPMVESAKKKKGGAKQVASDVVSSAGSIAGTLITGNPILGMAASSGIRAATSSINDSGNVVVDVSAGYEFYVYEHIEEKK